MKIRYFLASIFDVVLLFAALGGCNAHAQSITPEFGIGADQYAVTPNGTWHQTEAPDNRLTTHGRAFSVGVVANHPLGDHFGIVAHADYVNLGHVRSYCECTTVDADYNHITEKIAPGSPTAVFSGDGLVQGIKFSAAPYVALGDWLVGYERGLLYYRPHFTDSVYGWSASGVAPYENVSLTSPTAMQHARVFGFFASRGAFTLSYEQYRMPTQHNEVTVPPLYTGSHVLMLSYAL